MRLSITDNCVNCKFSRIRPVEDILSSGDAAKQSYKALYCVKYKGEYSHRHPEDRCLLFEPAVIRKGADE